MQFPNSTGSVPVPPDLATMAVSPEELDVFVSLTINLISMNFFVACRLFWFTIEER